MSYFCQEFRLIAALKKARFSQVSEKLTTIYDFDERSYTKTKRLVNQKKAE